MTSESTSAVLVENRGNVAVITINRPEARNAVNSAVTDGLGNALHEADQDPEIRAIVVTGSGDKRGDDAAPCDPSRPPLPLW